MPVSAGPPDAQPPAAAGLAEERGVALPAPSPLTPPDPVELPAGSAGKYGSVPEEGDIGIGPGDGGGALGAHPAQLGPLTAAELTTPPHGLQGTVGAQTVQGLV